MNRPVAIPLFVSAVLLWMIFPPKTCSTVLEDVSDRWGLVFEHFNGMSGEFYFPEMTGSGAALFDYDNDGDLDAYLVQGGMLGPGKTLADALRPPSEGSLTDRLFRNDLTLSAGGKLVPHFVDATASSGLAAAGYGMGVAAGDIDNDGFVDLYVTNFGANELWRNRGNGTFEEVADKYGVAGNAWSTSAAFADLDSDGRLDLYVVNYVEFDLVRNPACYATSSRRDYCGPGAFRPLADRLFHNVGGGEFEDVTHQWLRDYKPGPGLGVAFADLNTDGKLDIFVANDGAENQFWQARGDGTWQDEALFSGVAVNRQGRAEASMGVAIADFDSDGDEDVFLTHLMGETNTLYVNDGSGLFEDRSLESGLGTPSAGMTGFGTGWLDLDNDGRLDLLVSNGAVRILEEQAATGEVFPLRQPNQAFRNTVDGFIEATAAAGSALAVSAVSRGAAFGDIDNDGDIDVLVMNNNGPLQVLGNETRPEASWLGVSGGAGHPNGGAWPFVGTTVSVTVGGGGKVRRRAATDGSYCSAGDPRVVAGLGNLGRAAESVELRLDWAGAGATAWKAPPVGSYLRMHRSKGSSK